MPHALRSLVCLVLLCIGSAEAQHNPAPTSISVPLSYEEPALGTARLALDYAAPFDPAKPTVLVIADGQQFYGRTGAMKELRESTFGDAVNVVGIITRGTTPAFIDATLSTDGKPDWPKAWKVFNSGEWSVTLNLCAEPLLENKAESISMGAPGEPTSFISTSHSIRTT